MCPPMPPDAHEPSTWFSISLFILNEILHSAPACAGR